jgi:predicted GIY-YIG superfamily endonuclease
MLGLHPARIFWSTLHWFSIDLDTRYAQHLRGHTATTNRLRERLEIIAKKEVPTLLEARRIESALKRKKNPKVAIYHVQR